ncbi:unnamed protein product, partial [Symbiodinium natans]
MVKAVYDQNSDEQISLEELKLALGPPCMCKMDGRWRWVSRSIVATACSEVEASRAVQALGAPARVQAGLDSPHISVPEGQVQVWIAQECRQREVEEYSPGPGPEGTEGTPCHRHRLEVMPTGEAVEQLLKRRLEGWPMPSEPPRQLQGGQCCPAQQGGQPTDEMKQAMNQATGGQQQPLSTGSQANYCHFTELYDVLMGECVKGRCRSPNTRPDENRFCRPIPLPELNTLDPAAAVSDELKLSGLPAKFDLDSVLQGGTDRQDFEIEFIRDLAQQLDIPVRMLEVTDVTEGSVIVSFRILPDTEDVEAPLNPSIVQMSLATVRQTMDTAAAADSILTFTDTAHGVAAPATTQRAQQLSGQEALMQAFDGEALEKVPARTVETPEIYSLSPVGIGGRTKVNEYLPRSRAQSTQDEKWDAPEKVDIDLAVFITPVHKKVEAALLCPTRALEEDPVAKMWQRDALADGFGGNFLFNTPEMIAFKSWRIPKDRRMTVMDCETFDWLEAVMKDKAARSGKNFSESQNPYTSEKMKHLDASCGIPEEAWVNTSCQDLKTLQAVHKDQYRVSCNQELFASSTMRKTISIPFNGKWIQAASRREGSLYKPEWMLDTLTSYYFTWDSTAEDTEKLFSKNAPAGGDVQLLDDQVLCTARGEKTPCPVEVLYTGKILYKGEHSGDNKKVLEKTRVLLSQLPASSPTFQPTIEIHMDINRTVELVRRGRPRWWSREERVLREVLQCNVRSYWEEHRSACMEHGVDQQPAFPFLVDLEEAMADVTAARDKSMTLQTGVVYTIDVTLAVMPLYVKDTFGSITISTFYVEVESARVSSKALGFKERNQAQVRLKFKLSEKAKAMLKQPVMPWADLASESGAWFGIWGLASVVLTSLYSSLKMWGNLGPRDGELTMEEYQAKHESKIHILKKKSARKIQAQLEAEYQQYGIRVSYQKVYDQLVAPSRSRNLRKKVLLKSVLKDTNPLAGLPEHVASLLGEVRVALDDVVDVDKISEYGDNEDEELAQMEEEER